MFYYRQYLFQQYIIDIGVSVMLKVFSCVCICSCMFGTFLCNSEIQREKEVCSTLIHSLLFLLLMTLFLIMNNLHSSNIF
jgi:hypothetical protein